MMLRRGCRFKVDLIWDYNVINESYVRDTFAFPIHARERISEALLRHFESLSVLGNNFLKKGCRIVFSAICD